MAYVFTDKDLFVGGRPRGSDIAQDSIANCYLLGAAGAVADQQPEQIRIAYDAKTTQFTASLFKDGKRVEYSVSQSELREDFKRRGGSTYDNRGSGAIWPAVLEVAYAKSLDSNLADGLAEGWTKLGRGGKPIDAMYALTGSPGEALDQTEIERLGTQKSFQKLREALAQGRPITLNVLAESGLTKDGLVNGHSYIVQSAFVDTKGDARLQLRNPWGANITNSEGAEPATIKFENLLRTGSLGYFNIGPAPVKQAQPTKVTDSSSKQPDDLRQVADLLNDMFRDLGLPNGEAKLAGRLQALRDMPAGKEFAALGSVEIERTTVRVQNEAVRMTPRMSEPRVQRIGM